jgi:hypothetical protein
MKRSVSEDCKILVFLTAPLSKGTLCPQASEVNKLFCRKIMPVRKTRIRIDHVCSF